MLNWNHLNLSCLNHYSIHALEGVCSLRVMMVRRHSLNFINVNTSNKIQQKNQKKKSERVKCKLHTQNTAVVMCKLYKIFVKNTLLFLFNNKKKIRKNKLFDVTTARKRAREIMR